MILFHPTTPLTPLIFRPAPPRTPGTAGRRGGRLGNHHPTGRVFHFCMNNMAPDKPPLAVQGTVKAVWDSLSMTIEATRSIPLMYTQLINPKTKTAFDPGAGRNWEIR